MRRRLTDTMCTCTPTIHSLVVHNDGVGATLCVTLLASALLDKHTLLPLLVIVVIVAEKTIKDIT